MDPRDTTRGLKRRSASSGFLLRRRGAEFFVAFFHLFLEVFARCAPDRLHEGNMAAPFALAVVLSGVVATAALPFTVILTRARMVPGGRRTVPLTGAVILAIGALSFTGIEAATGVRLTL